MLTASGSPSAAALFAPDADVRVEEVRIVEGEVIHVALRCARHCASCPVCGHEASRVHSVYSRSLADLAWRGFPVRLAVRVRRFRCGHATCPRALFAERLDDLAGPYARRTTRLTRTLTRVGMALGGEAGARLLPILGASASPSTMLRLVRRSPPPTRPTPRVLGVDDWARRRGHTYGTVLVDLERRVPVELLPDREAATFAQWLREHPGVEVIARDRAEAYAQGARDGAPAAVQVADRWHLLKNVGELLERLLHAHRAALAEAALAEPAPASAPTPPARDSDPAASSSAPRANPSTLPTPEGVRRSPEPLTPARAVAAGRQAARQARYDQVKALRAQGLSHRAIGTRVGMTPATVRKYLAAPTCPTRAPRRTKVGTLTRVDAHLRARWQEGCEDALVLWREVQEIGFRGSLRTIQRHVERWRATGRRTDVLRATASSAPRPPSPRQVRWWLTLPAERLSEGQRCYVARLTEACAPIRAARQLAVTFGVVLRGGEANALGPWLEDATESGLTSFQDFAAGLRRDQASIEAAIREPWSNGQTEGQVNKLKMLKRQMYGRAGLPLLRQRMLATAA
ncbi:MAG: ISL3 family transposase [Myxococcaceae bacterium]|nr:MAG: ISL3 family transposase [Myxococcaceae bacterium]